MKTAAAFILLLVLTGCEPSTHPSSTVLSPPDSARDTVASVARPDVGSLIRIGTRSDSTHPIDFVWTDTSGKPDSLSNYRGKKVLLNFWATWCPPCQEEIPALEAVAGRLGDSIKLIGVSIDGIPPAFQTVSNFAVQNGINYPIVSDSTAALYMAYPHGRLGIPQTYIIAKDGTIRFFLLGPQSEQTFDSCLARAN